MDYCQACSGITVESLVAGFRHPKPLEQILESASNCRMCNHISQAMSNWTREHKLADCHGVYLDTEGYIRNVPLPTPADLGDCQRIGRFNIGVELGASADQAMLTARTANNKQGSKGKKELRARGARRIVHYTPSSSADSKECFRFLQRNLDLCAKWHASCNQRRNGFPGGTRLAPLLPTRVVDVGSPDDPVKIFVQPSNPEERRRAKYITLSHCWGPKETRPITTTSHNLEQHKEAIPFQRLPKTFQDAVTITRRLGVRYLWIDSLCILQDEDDLSDWEREAKTMGSVYQHSYLTIAATGASNSTHGCFIPRVAPDLNEIPLSARPEERPRVFLYLPSAVRTVPQDLGPLAHRAWITQEWALSPRTIHYCSGLLVWMCDHIRQTECGLGDGKALSGDGIWRTPLNHGWSWAERMFEDWNKIVQGYTSRSLTKTTDRLVALQGLINKLEEAGQKRCIFGVWCHKLPQDLLWERRVDRPVLAWPKELQDRGIPSWSWASKVGEVTWRAPFPSATEPFATVELPKPDSKELTLHSSLKKIPQLKVRHHSGQGCSARFYALDETGNQIGEILFDSSGPVDLEEAKGTDYFILPLMTTFYPHIGSTISGLVIGRVAGDSGLFQREGVIRDMDSLYFDGSDREVICLV